VKLIAVIVTVVLLKFFPVDYSRLNPTGNNQPGRISARGTSFVAADGQPFVWRGITAFRLVEFVATGRKKQAAAYLDWAATNRITVVRVLAMAHNLFRLSPADGLKALPTLLQLAAARGMHVEIVALADSALVPVDVEAHLAAIGKIAAAHPNAFVEIANEPFHPTQHPALRDDATLARLAALIPDEVLVAYGAGAPEDAPAGDYVTVHTPRGEAPWDHVLSLAEGRALVDRVRRPVVSDEPIGAAATREPGSRDNSPERFRAAALLTRMAGMHATFHYEGGLHARIPEGVELACFRAWGEAWTLLPANIEQGTFRRLQGAREHAFENVVDGQRYVLTIRNGRADLARPGPRRLLPRE